MGKHKKISIILSVISLLVICGAVFVYLRKYKADNIAPPLNTNILQNPNFDNNLAHWSHGTNGTSATATIEAGYDGQSLKLQSGSDTTWQAVTQNLAINAIAPGYYYELTCKYKTTPGHNTSIGIYIDDSTKLSISKNAYGNNGWQTLTNKFYLPLTDSVGASTLNRAFRVNLYGFSSGNNHDPVYYDNVILQRIEPPDSSTDWSASPGNDSNHPTTTNSYYLDVKNPTPGAVWYNVNDGNYDHWTDQAQSSLGFSTPPGVNQGQVLLTLYAWSDKPENGGILLNQYPDSIPIFYDFSIREVKFSIQATDQGNGSMLLKAIPPEGTSQTLLDQIQYYCWDYNLPTTVDGNTTWNYYYNNNTGSSPELLISFAQPGIEYMKVYAQVASNYNPKASISSPSTNFVIGMPPENGNALTIIDGWSTNHFIATTPIPGDLRFSLMKDSITLFSDGNLNLPLNSKNGKTGINPDKTQIDLPIGISISKGNINYFNITDISASAGASLENGYKRYQLTKNSTGWGWSNNNILIFPHFDNDSVIGQANLHMRIRAFKNSDIARTDNWQSFGIHCEVIPTIQLPKRLTTSYTWTTQNGLSVNTGAYPNNTNFYSLYKKLGFNTVPLAGGDLYQQNNALLATPAERQTPSWQDLKFGPEYSPLYGGYWGLGYFTALSLSDYNAKYGLSLTDSDIDAHVDNIDFNAAFGFSLSSQDIDLEKTKWKNALHFYALHGIVDIAYDGVFRSRDLADMTAKMDHTRPEYVFLDIESFGSYSSWRNYIGDSINAQNKKLNSETGAELAYRLTDEFLATLNASITSVSPNTKIAFYDTHAEYNVGYQNFPWPLLQKNNFIAQPSVYVTGRNIDGYSQLLRNNRAFLPAHAELIPWITNGTYGELDPDNIFDQVIHTFLNGGTGFSVFDSDFVDDMADTLNMTKAIGLVSPYEDIIMDGDIAYGDISNVENATVSAMKLNGQYLLAVTPKNKALPVSFKINTGLTTNYTLADLRHSTFTSSNTAIVNYSNTLSESTVMRLVGGSDQSGLTLTVNPPKTFTYKPKATISGTKSAQVTRVRVNGVDASLDNNANTWSIDANLSFGQNILTIVANDDSDNFTSTTKTVIRRKLADANNDSIVNDADFTLLLYNWNSTSPNNIADFNEDGKVDESDFTVLLYWWGN